MFSKKFHQKTIILPAIMKNDNFVSLQKVYQANSWCLRENGPLNTAELQLITPALRRKLTFEKISQEEINFGRKLTLLKKKSREEINFNFLLKAGVINCNPAVLCVCVVSV